MPSSRVSFSATTRTKRFDIHAPPHSSLLKLARYEAPSLQSIAPAATTPTPSPVSPTSAAWSAVSFLLSPQSWFSSAAAAVAPTVPDDMQTFALSENHLVSPIRSLHSEVEATELNKAALDRLTLRVDLVTNHYKGMRRDMSHILAENEKAAEELLELQDALEELNELLHERRGKSITLIQELG
ncbi:hypothetical protein RI367_000672 [Sorochytrium milnesiophthora]